MNMQRHLNEVALDCLDILDSLNIPYGEVMEFTVNTTAKSRWGQTKRNGNFYYINIAEILTDGNHDDGLKNTLLHELLHTCPNCMNHGAQWKAYAAMVNDRYGIKITRCNSAEEKGVDREEWIGQKKILHRYHCKDCGQVITRSRESKFTRHYNMYLCGKCHGRFVMDF